MDGYTNEIATRSSQGSACFMCLSFVLCIFSTISPFYLWRYSYSSIDRVSSSLGTGSWVLSTSNTPGHCTWYQSCFYSTQWNHYDQFNDTVCTLSTLYDQVGQFGFCNDNKEFITPKGIAAMQGLIVTCCVVLFLGAIFALVGPQTHKSVSMIAVICSVVACICSCATFSLIVTEPYFKSLRTGGYLLLRSIGKDCGDDFCAVTSPKSVMYYGPVFYILILVFVITLGTSCTLCVAVKRVHEYDSIDGAYGSGIPHYPTYEKFEDGRTRQDDYEYSGEFGYGDPIQA